MSTNAIVSFIDKFDNSDSLKDLSGEEEIQPIIHVYCHYDGYPTGMVDKIQKAMGYAWPLPRFVANDFSAAFVAANRVFGEPGNTFLCPWDSNLSNLITPAIEWRYEVYIKNHVLCITVYGLRNQETTLTWDGKFKDLLQAAIVLEDTHNENSDNHQFVDSQIKKSSHSIADVPSLVNFLMDRSTDSPSADDLITNKRGQKGGIVRAKKLSSKKKKQIASKAANARWGKTKPVKKPKATKKPKSKKR